MKEYKNVPSRARKRKAQNPLIEEFKDSEEYRYAYAEEHLNTNIALQIRVLREQRGMKQSDLAEALGTKQPGVARLENVNYSKWNTETLKKVARALGVRLKITFETFGTLLDEDASFSRESLQRPDFEEDPAFKDPPVESMRDLAEILNALETEGQKSNVTPIQEYLERHVQRQEGTNLYENLVDSTSKNRRPRAS